MAKRAVIRNSSRKYWAEALGTFGLVFGGVGALVLNNPATNLGAPPAAIPLNSLYTGLAFGIALLGMLYTLARVSGGHFNPAVSIGMALANRVAWKDVVPYIIAQVVGGAIAAFIIYLIVMNRAGGYTGSPTFVSNGVGAGYTVAAVIAIEILAAFVFMTVILGTTAKKAVAGFAPLIIALTLVLAHMISFSASGTSLNPSRSTATALVAGVIGNLEPLKALWIFWVAPIVGAGLAGYLYPMVFGEE
jgi:aquaporin Z